MAGVVVNGAFWPQKVTGQQRYAREIAARLIARRPVVGRRPGAAAAASTLRTWAWVLLALPLRTRRDVLVSLTARAPLVHRRHVLVVHDLFVLTHPGWFSRRYVWTHAPLLRLQLRTARVLVAVSEPVAEEVRAFLPHADVRVAPNAASDVFAGPGDASGEALRLRGLAAGSYLLAVGSMDPRKNLVRLAAAYGRLSPEERAAVPLVVVGGGEAIFRDQDIDWPTGAVPAGYVSDEELRDLYAGCRAVVFASLAEGFGLPLVEALAAGTPRLVVSDLAVFRWICGDSAVYVDPQDVDGIAAGLRTALGDGAPVARAVREFDWDASADVVRRAALDVAGVR